MTGKSPDPLPVRRMRRRVGETSWNTAKSCKLAGFGRPRLWIGGFT